METGGTLCTMVGSILSLNSAAIIREAVQIMVRVLVIYYLNQEPVKEWFAKS